LVFQGEDARRSLSIEGKDTRQRTYRSII